MKQRLEEKRNPDEAITQKTEPIIQNQHSAHEAENDLVADDKTVPVRPFYKSIKSRRPIFSVDLSQNNIFSEMFSFVRRAIFILSLCLLSFYAGMYNWGNLHSHFEDYHLALFGKIGLQDFYMSAKPPIQDKNIPAFMDFTEKTAIKNANVRTVPNAKGKISNQIKIGDSYLTKPSLENPQWDEIYLKQPDANGNMIKIGFVNSNLLNTKSKNDEIPKK